MVSYGFTCWLARATRFLNEDQAHALGEDLCTRGRIEEFVIHEIENPLHGVLNLIDVPEDVDRWGLAMTELQRRRAAGVHEPEESILADFMARRI